MPSFSHALAGPGYIILNVFRVLNVLSIMAIITANCVLLIKLPVYTKFFVFESITHAIVINICIFLISSELSLFRSYFYRNWPLLSPIRGFVTLGLAMVVLGISTLGTLNRQSSSEQSLGLAFWRIVAGSGIVAIVLGCFNMLNSFIFRDSSNGVTARHVRSYGAVAPQRAQLQMESANSASCKLGPYKSFRLCRQSTLHSHHSEKISLRSSPVAEKVQPLGPRVPVNISAPLNPNPQFTDYVRISPPDMAHHPAASAGNEMRP
ncbi:hypothetical protein L228DRAFT_82211 [Xylona heveae TC161]|uniref:DUF7598 domain-containing protein n=1 Tax=Xylona heveae (strain CBS 132557 / TC161) TaxID=1328760 RepID=A0A165J4C8_XYLHT|nr:hypothetical protein L228DRAFT_82211 [Xylona heveae TC161]KZF25713.1 hypothetical protein L228DRAFT_82211 [Xylona heveae TC161]